MKHFLLTISLIFPSVTFASSVCDIDASTLGSTFAQFEKKRRPNAEPRRNIPDDFSVQVFGNEHCRGNPLYKSARLTFRFIDKKLGSVVFNVSSKDKGRLLREFESRFGKAQRGKFSKYSEESDDYWWSQKPFSLSYRATRYSGHWLETIYLSSATIKPERAADRKPRSVEVEQ